MSELTLDDVKKAAWWLGIVLLVFKLYGAMSPMLIRRKFFPDKFRSSWFKWKWLLYVLVVALTGLTFISTDRPWLLLTFTVLATIPMTLFWAYQCWWDCTDSEEKNRQWQV